jgi:electron transport complex protein RnfC
MRQTAPADLDVSVQPLQVKYPQGAEKMLIKAVTGREVPSGKLPASVGALV